MTDAAAHPLKRPAAALTASRPTEQLKEATKPAKKGKKGKSEGPKERLCLYLDHDIAKKVRLMGVDQGVSMSDIVSKLVEKAPEPSFTRS